MQYYILEESSPIVRSESDTNAWRCSQSWISLPPPHSFGLLTTRPRRYFILLGYLVFLSSYCNAWCCTKARPCSLSTSFSVSLTTALLLSPHAPFKPPIPDGHWPSVSEWMRPSSTLADANLQSSSDSPTVCCLLFTMSQDFIVQIPWQSCHSWWCSRTYSKLCYENLKCLWRLEVTSWASGIYHNQDQIFISKGWGNLPRLGSHSPRAPKSGAPFKSAVKYLNIQCSMQTAFSKQLL